MGNNNSFSKCSYCGRQIIWIRTKVGKNMPADPEIISYRMPEVGERATEKIVTEKGEVICANKTDSHQAEGFGYISHFATCPMAGKRRKKG